MPNPDEQRFLETTRIRAAARNALEAQARVVAFAATTALPTEQWKLRKCIEELDKATAEHDFALETVLVALGRES